MKAPKPTKLQATLLVAMIAPDRPCINMRWHRPYHPSGQEVYRGALIGYRGTVYDRTVTAMIDAGWLTRQPRVKGVTASGVQPYGLTAAGAALATELKAGLQEPPNPT